MRTCELRGHAGELGFIPRDQVRWLSPGELARTAVKVVLAAVFASYSDKREIQAALDSGLLRAPLREPDTATELWVDYVADLGDGFGRADARMRDKVDPPLRFARAQVTYPDASTSRRLAYPWSVHWLGRRNPGFPQLAAGVHATLFVALSVLLGFALGTRHPIKAVRSGLDAVGGIIGLGGLGVLLLLGWIKRWARTREANAPPSNTAVDVLMQLAVALTILVVTVVIPWPADWPGWSVLALCLVVAGVLGAGLGCEAFALYILSVRTGAVAEWQMSGQAIEDHKGFLRLHIAPEGDLTIYPLVIDEVCYDWELADDPTGGKRPVPAAPLPSPRLIESPVVIAREVSAP